MGFTIIKQQATSVIIEYLKKDEDATFSFFSS
jgi:hypothetical protein